MSQDEQEQFRMHPPSGPYAEFISVGVSEGGMAAMTTLSPFVPPDTPPDYVPDPADVGAVLASVARQFAAEYHDRWGLPSEETMGRMAEGFVRSANEDPDPSDTVGINLGEQKVMQSDDEALGLMAAGKVLWLFGAEYDDGKMQTGLVWGSDPIEAAAAAMDGTKATEGKMATRLWIEGVEVSGVSAEAWLEEHGDMMRMRRENREKRGTA